MHTRTPVERFSDALKEEFGINDPFSAAVRASRLAMVVTDARLPDNPIIFVNEAFEKLTGYSREESLGRNCRFMQGPGTAPEDLQRIRDAIAEERDAAVDILNYRKNGEAFWNALYISPVRDEAGEVAYFFGSQLDVTGKKQAQFELLRAKQGLEAAVAERTRDLQAALDQKTALLHEVDHRVKNNLQLIASLVMLQMRRTPEGAARDALRSMLDRVSAISTVHRRLFQSDDVERFDVGEFLRDLMEDRVGLRGRDAVVLPERAAAVTAAQAAPLALLVSELLAYAQDGGPPESLRLELERAGDGVRLRVHGAEGAGHVDAFGREIVEMLARQLRGVAKFEAAGGERRAELTLPNDIA